MSKSPIILQGPLQLASPRAPCAICGRQSNVWGAPLDRSIMPLPKKKPWGHSGPPCQAPSSYLRRIKIRKKIAPFWAQPTPALPLLCHAMSSSLKRKTIITPQKSDLSIDGTPTKKSKFVVRDAGANLFFCGAPLCFNVGFPCSLRCL